jgi:hypothetical protein
MARSSEVSVRDIMSASKAVEPREDSIDNYTNVKQLTRRARSKKVHLVPICSFARLSPALEPPREVVQGHRRF